MIDNHDEIIVIHDGYSVNLIGRIMTWSVIQCK